MSFSWTGRQLDSVTKDGVTTTYTYDSNGLRTSKTTGDDVTEYTYLGSSLVYQVTNKGQSDEVSLYFYYDDTGLAAFYYESAQYPSDNGIYHYVKDAQGNIWGIVDNKGTQIVKYEFSAYGEYRSRWNPEEVSSGEISRNIRIRNANPFDYRGYYYDTETGLYYCQSRYYDPEVDRLLSVDDELAGIGGAILGYNLFAYCFNDPVNMSDPTGNWPKWITNAANWLNDNIFKPIGDFFSPDTNSVSGSFSEGAFKGAGSVTLGYNEIMLRGQNEQKIYPKKGEPSLTVGAFGKVSVVNASGKVGIGNDNLSVSAKATGDVLTATVQGGVKYQNGVGLTAKAKASVASGRATVDFEVFGWEIEFGLSGDLLSAGAEATIGIFDGTFVFDVNAALGVGAGIIFRAKPPQ